LGFERERERERERDVEIKVGLVGKAIKFVNERLGIPLEGLGCT
jgi:hypothetical protein